MKLEKGFKQFIIKSGIFMFLFILIQLITIPLQKIQLPNEYYILLDGDVGKALLFTVVIFFFLAREKLKNLRAYKFDIKIVILFGILSLLIFSGYFIFKSFLGNNPVLALKFIYLFLPLKYFILIIGAITLLTSIFGVKLFHLFIKEFKKEIIISSLIFVLALFLIIQFQKLWLYLSLIVAKDAYFLLNLTFDAFVNLKETTPTLGIGNFIITIGKPCSGIDSILLFIFLYFFIIGLDWKIINKKKAALLFIPGIISVFCLNIIRIYLLIVIGNYISRDFALGVFHSSASMIFFIIYFAIFWLIFYKWMKKK